MSKLKSKCCKKFRRKGRACGRCPLAALLRGEKVRKKIRRRLPADLSEAERAKIAA